ncbi:MAG: hypothetical protein AB7F59_03680 [Bdellovibrionales bacterium]
MKSLGLLLFSLCLTLNASAAQKTCDQRDLARAQELYDTSKDRVEKGTMAPISLIEAEHNLLEVKICHQNLGDPKSCEQRVGLLKKLIEARKAQFDVGLASVDFVVAAHEKMREAKRDCGLVEK